MRSITYLLILCSLPSWITAQSFQTGNNSVVFTDPSRSGRQIPTDLYYPADSRGTGVPVASGTTAFPVVVFGHGFSLAPSSYVRLADSLVSHGFIVAMPSTETGLAPSHDNFGKDIAFLADAVTALSANSSSFLYQRVSNKAAVSGHSMGGGCSFLGAASGNASIKALFNFAAAETNPSATYAASSVNVPSLIFSGSSDCIVPPATQLAMYNNIPAACKTWINITGGTHCQIANNNATCTFGQITSGCNSSSINADVFLNTSLYLLLPFLDYHLKGNCYRGVAFIDRYNIISGVTAKQNTCPPPVCSPLSVSIINLTGRFAANKVNLQWDTEQEGNVQEYSLEKSANGSAFSEINRRPSSGNTRYHYEAVDRLPFPQSTYYRVKAINFNGSFSYSDIINVQTPKSSLILTHSFPNPAMHAAGISIESLADENLFLQLMTSDGKLAYRDKKTITRGTSLISIPLEGLATGLYWLIIKDSEGNTVKKENLMIH